MKTMGHFYRKKKKKAKHCIQFYNFSVFVDVSMPTYGSQFSHKKAFRNSVRCCLGPQEMMGILGVTELMSKGMVWAEECRELCERPIH